MSRINRRKQPFRGASLLTFCCLLILVTIVPRPVARAQVVETVGLAISLVDLYFSIKDASHDKKKVGLSGLKFEIFPPGQIWVGDRFNGQVTFKFVPSESDWVELTKLDITVTVENFKDSKWQALGTKYYSSPERGSAKHTVDVTFQAIDTGSAKIRVRVDASWGGDGPDGDRGASCYGTNCASYPPYYQCYCDPWTMSDSKTSSNEFTVNVGSPIQFDWPDGQMTTVSHELAKGNYLNFEVRNKSSAPFTIMYLESSDNLWDEDCGDMMTLPGRGNLEYSHENFYPCVTHDWYWDCADPHPLTTASWNEYTYFAGNIFHDVGRWFFFSGVMDKLQLCCGADSLSSSCAGVISFCNNTIDCIVYPPPPDSGEAVFGPIVEPRIVVPLPGSFVIHTPLPEVSAAPWDTSGGPDVMIDSVLVNDLIGLYATTTAGGIDGAISQPSDTSMWCDFERPVDPCDRCDATFQPDTSMGESNSGGVIRLPGSYLEGGTVRLTLLETDYFKKRYVDVPIALTDSMAASIKLIPKVAPKISGILRLPDGRRASGSVLVEAPPEIASRVQSLSDSDLAKLGVPYMDSLVTINKSRVLLPLGAVHRGVIDIGSQELRTLGYPTADLVFRSKFWNGGLIDSTTIINNLETVISVPTREGIDNDDVIEIGTVQMTCPLIAAACDVPSLPRELAVNGDFASGTIFPFTEDVNFEIGHPMPRDTVEDIDSLSNALHIYRPTDSDSSHFLVSQFIGLVIENGNQAILNFDVRIASHNFGSYDSWNVYPANVEVDYWDAGGFAHTFRRSFYSYVESGHTPDPLPVAAQIPAGTWTSRSFDLTALVIDLHEIKEVRVGARGYSYDVAFDNVSITVNSSTDCSVAPISIDCGTVQVGSSSERTFAISNLGGSVINGSVAESCPHFRIVSGAGSYSLGPGESQDVRVRFEPIFQGDFTCKIDTGPLVCQDVTLTGVATSSPPGPFPRKTFAIQGALPSPFNPSTQVVFAVDRESLVILSIYDVAGRRVKTLVNRRLLPGEYREEWNGRDESGRALPSGVYFLHLQSKGRVLKKKIVLLK